MTNRAARQRQIEAKRSEGGVHSKTMDDDEGSICRSRSKLVVTCLPLGLIFQEELALLAGTDFFHQAKREPHPRTRIRLLALGHLQSGKTKSEIIDICQITFPTLRAWLLRFIEDGVNGLREKQGKGRKRKLACAQEEEFRQQVEALQQSREGGKIRGRDVQLLLKEKFSVDHALPSVYHILL